MVMKKSVLVFTFFFLVSSVVVAQPVPGSYDEVNDCLRFMPTRMTNHVRVVREYEPSTVVMGARKLLKTTYYDRHGYETRDGMEYTYDSLDRLVGWTGMERRWDNDSQSMVWDITFDAHIDYSPEGLVSLYRFVAYDRVGSAIDTTVITYRLIHLVRSTSLGITECDYLYTERPAPDRLTDEVTDTCRFRREYDGKGRLVRESYTDDVGSRGLDSYEVRYAYDPQGRKQYEKNRFYGGSDSIGYRYSALGGVVEKSGKEWAEGFETDIFISCRPDGSPLESTHISYPQEWDYGDNPEQRSITRRWYNAMGDLIREETSDHTLEYDVEYWEIEN